MIVSEKKERITESKDIAFIMQKIYAQRQNEDAHKEIFYCIGLNSDNTILYIDMVAIGTVNQCVPSVRECVRLGLIKNAVSLIVVHNHPSGNVLPSVQDKAFTQKIKEACAVLDINLLDHIIVTENNSYSFSDNCDL